MVGFGVAHVTPLWDYKITDSVVREAARRYWEGGGIGREAARRYWEGGGIRREAARRYWEGGSTAVLGGLSTDQLII